MIRGLMISCISKITNKGKRIITCRCFKNMLKTEPRIDEKIDEYDNVLTGLDRKYSLAEEINSRMYGVKTMLDESWADLKDKEENQGKKSLSGVHTYDILRNPAYVESFQYYSADLPSRDDFIIDDDVNDENNSSQSDFVRIVINLAYLKQSALANLDLSPDGLLRMAGSKDQRDEAQRQIDEIK